MKRIVSLTVNVLAFFVFGAVVLFGAPMAKAAAVPQAINYQAVLLDDAGEPVTEPVDITFTIYDTETRGAQLWQETILGVDPDDNGQFSLILGKTVAITDEVLSGEPRWLGIKVGEDEEITPRTELVSSAYSFRVSTVDQATAGTLYGPLTIEESAARAADASLILVGAAADTIQLSPADEIILRATTQSGEEVMSATMSDLEQSAQLTMRIDACNEAVYSASGAEFNTSVAKAFEKKLTVGAEGLFFFGATEAEDLLKIEEEAAGQALFGITDYSAKAEGASVRIRAPNSTLPEVFSVQNSAGDPTFELESDPAVGTSMNFYSTAALRAAVKKATLATEGLSLFGASESEELLKIEEETPGVVSITGTDYSAKAAGASIKIRPPTASQAEVFTVNTSTGDPSFQLESDPSAGASMSFYSTGAKANDVMIVSNDGIFFTNLARSETLMTITKEGNINGKGQISMGQNMSNPGDFANVLGFNNSAIGDSSGVLGGWDNEATAAGAFVGGGSKNKAGGAKGDGVKAVIGGGLRNEAIGRYAAILGGEGNTASGQYTVVCGGKDNHADWHMSSILGGEANYTNRWCAVALGGLADTVIGKYSMAFGNHVKIDEDYQVAFWDGDTSGMLGINRDSDDGVDGIDYPLHVGTDATNGNGAYLSAGGAWTDGSSRGFKENFQQLDGREVLDRLGQLPMESWEYTGTGERHIWPCAEDFHEQFDVGVIKEDGTRDVKYLAAGDVAGVALVGVQELYRMVQEFQAKTQEIEGLRAQLDEQEQLKGRIAQLEALVETLLAQQDKLRSGDDKMAINQ